MFKRCYNTCAICKAKSFEYEHNCTKCETNFHFIYNELNKGKCIHENEKPINTYLDLETNVYELCYERCYRCSQKNDIVNNNCDECAKDNKVNYIYHFLENEKGKCINEKEKPINTYLDLNDNTYKYCYERCRRCNLKGDRTNNNCDECAKDNNGKYTI